MLFAIKNTETGKYVAKPGSEHSYTNIFRQIRFFETKIAAEKFGICRDNEVIQQIAGS